MLTRITFFLALFFNSALLYGQHAPVSNTDIRVHLDSTRSLPIKGERGLAAASVFSFYDFKLEKEEQVEWMYATVKVPVNETPACTYYCVIQGDGFYTGMQQVTGQQRQVIFSVWDEKDGNNFERTVKQTRRAVLLAKSDGVLEKRFQGEGSGQQTRWLFDWQPEETYQFLTHIQRDTIACITTFTQYFHTGREWKMIAKISRPNFIFHGKSYGSFLEDWSGRNDKYRRAMFLNQLWEKTTGGKWKSANISYVGINTKKKLRNYGVVACTDGGYFMVSGAGFTDYYLSTNTMLPYIGKEAAPVFTLPE